MPIKTISTGKQLKVAAIKGIIYQFLPDRFLFSSLSPNFQGTLDALKVRFQGELRLRPLPFFARSKGRGLGLAARPSFVRWRLNRKESGREARPANGFEKPSARSSLSLELSERVGCRHRQGDQDSKRFTKL